MKAVSASGDRGIFEMLVATHANLTTEQFSQIAM